MALEGWPPQAGSDRSARILEEIDVGNYEHEWCDLLLSNGTGTLALQVSCDALKIDGVRVNVDAPTLQAIADRLGAVMLTPKLADQMWLKTTRRIPPSPQPFTSSTAAMVEHSQRVDRLEVRTPGSGLVADPGKDWVLVAALFTASARAARKAANYGWHVPSGGDEAVTPGLRVIQSVGTAHNDQHTDYSQIARFVRRSARFGELPVDMAEVYTGKAPGTDLVSHQGPLPDYRQPGSGNPLPVAPGGGPAILTGRASLVAPVTLGAAGAAIGYSSGGGLLGGAFGALAGAVLGVIVRRA